VAVKRAAATKAPRQSTRAGSQVYDLVIELCEVTPRVWRRVLVPEWISLAQLHDVLQVAMGWTDSHLHAYAVAGARYGSPDDDWPELEFIDDRLAVLSSCVGSSVREFVYEYDFGDGWTHSIRVEGLRPPDDLQRYPICIGGANACPPEDIGGPGGYANFLEALADPSHAEHKDLLRWCGGIFDPQGFDLNAVNAALRRSRLARKR
jgi:hypothetical protein